MSETTIKINKQTGIPVAFLFVVLGWLVLGLGIATWNWHIGLAGIMFLIVGGWARGHPEKKEAKE